MRRSLSLIVALVQLAVPVAASVADGFHPHEQSIVHFEDATQDGCGIDHGSVCVLCRYLSGTALKPSGNAASADHHAQARAAASGLAVVFSAPRQGFNPRAPPTAP
jgi:hypothetical protein